MDIYAEGVEPEKMNRQELGDAIFDKLKERYDAKEELIGAEAMRHHERMIMLSVIDQQWKDHLLSMDHLQEGIGLRGYGQHDPLVEYKRESFDMFEAMMQRFEEETVRYLYLMQSHGAAARPGNDGRWRKQPVKRSCPARADAGVPSIITGGEAATDARRARSLPPWTKWKKPSSAARSRNWSRRAWPAPATCKCSRSCAGEKVGRNDPCPCGSGKKYKKCCGAN